MTWGSSPAQVFGSATGTPWITASGTVTTSTFTPASSPSSGSPSLLIAYIEQSNTGTFGVISDSASGTWSQLVGVSGSGSGTFIYGRLLTSSSTFTVTLGSETGNDGQMWLEEWAGSATSLGSVVDTYNTWSSGSNGTTTGSGYMTLTPNNANELVVGMVGIAGAVTSGFSVTGATGPASWAGTRMMPCYTVETTIVANTPDFSWSASRAWTSCMVALVPGGGVSSSGYFF